MAKWDAAVESVPTNITLAQLETALKNRLNNGWELKQIVLVTSTKIFAIFVKQLLE